MLAMFQNTNSGRRTNGLCILGMSVLGLLAIFQMDSSYKSHSKLTQHLSLEEVCQRESRSTPFRQIDPTDEPQQSRTLQSLFMGSGISSSSSSSSSAHTNYTNATKSTDDYAICEFHLMDAHNFHFPHTMQQLYRCWSWWRLRRDDNNLPNGTTPVLVFPPNGILPENAFLRGFAAALQSRIGLQIWSPRRLRRHRRKQPRAAAMIDDDLVRPRVPNNRLDHVNVFEVPDPAYYAMLQVDDAAVLRDTILGGRHNNNSSIRNSNTTVDKDNYYDDHCGNGSTDNNPTGKPRIAILNRHLSREWLNADDVVGALQPYAAQGEIPIVFLDGKTFLEQISFFRDVDVLLSPHGAQLTGLPFMPDCGSVLEIFPVGYHLPYYFGSLAGAANLRHGYSTVTLSGNWSDEAALVMPKLKERNRVRNTRLCPDVTVIVDGVLELIDGWKKCCRSKMQDQ